LETCPYPPFAISPSQPLGHTNYIRCNSLHQRACRLLVV
jgi:hypothetical protein